MSKLKISILSIVIIITGYLLYFFEGYKDTEVLRFVSFGLIFIGSAIIFTKFFGDFAFDYKVLKNRNSIYPIWIIKLSRLFLNVAFLGIVLGQIFLIIDLNDKRVAFVLQNGVTDITMATVTSIENRHNKYGNHYYAIISYQTKDKTINQAIEEIAREYSVGKVLRIKYSIEYPEMFKVE